MAHSSNVNIYGGTFNSAQGDLHINNRNPEYGLDNLLKLGVSLGAIHDSAERHPPPNCHPDTRKAVRKIILDWIYNVSSASSFFWLYGPAGAGKTAILQAIAEFLCSPSGSSQNFGGSFFFSRGKNGRDHGHFLFSTIAYQLALKVPGLRQHVNRIMESDPTLHAKSMDVQLQTLIVNAFQLLSPLPQRSYLVIIDGLDECHDKTTQQLILRLLCETITVHKLPLRFLIGSRPESHIRASFDQESLYIITHRVVLDETSNPGRDIRVFLQDGFAKICANNIILSHVEQPWPEERIIDLLVQRSSGQFIYAATVLKFVGADYRSPTKQLALVLKPDPSAFSDLDQLYTQILSVYPSAVNIVQILGIIVAFNDNPLPEVIEDILGMEEGELKLVLRGLSSLMEDENDENGESLNEGSYVIPHFAHASFGEYLSDSSRSGPFHVNRLEHDDQVTLRSFALIMQLIRPWGMSSMTRILHTTTWAYFTSRLPDRFIRSPDVVQEAIMTDINDLMQEFWRTSSDGDVGASFFAMRRLFEILQRCFNILERLAYPYLVETESRAKFKALFVGYRKMFDQSCSKSKELGDILGFLPGVVVQNSMSLQGMADLYRIKPDLLAHLIESTIEPLRPSDFSKLSPYSRYILDDYLSSFLQDRDRSQLYYCDPIHHHVSICRQFLFLLDGSNALDFQSHELSDYVNFHFYDHLCAATTGFFNAQNISDNHPAVEILHDLETTTYYIENSGYTLGRCIIQGILKWANKLKCRLKGVAVSVSNVNLMERVCHLTNKNYREMLCITRRENMTYITMGTMGRRDLDHLQVSTFSPQHRIVLSWDLLAWISMGDKNFCFFTDFITTPELSGHLYISPDIYHTQITEYSLETIYLRNHSLRSFLLSSNIYLIVNNSVTSRPSPFYRCFLKPNFLKTNWSFRKHLSRTLPTEMIFYLLRSIRSECLIPYCSAEFAKLMLDTLETIIKWLQGLGSERPNDLYDRFQSDSELLDPKPSPNFDF